MWYHAIAEHTSGKRYMWNRSKDDFVKDILIPVVSQQVNVVSKGGRKVLFNFGAVSYTTIIKTNKKLKAEKTGAIPKELKDNKFIKEHEATNEFVKDLILFSSSIESRSMIENSLREPINQIFVIMKIGDEILDSAYEGVIKPLGKEFGFKVLRVDEIQDSGDITNQIIENISKSRIILADLSKKRPNCYYEAGFAQALRKKIIFSIRKDESIHFDLSHYRFIKWKTEAEFRRELRKRLSSIKEKASD
jgi:hypothetical protein